MILPPLVFPGTGISSLLHKGYNYTDIFTLNASSQEQVQVWDDPGSESSDSTGGVTYEQVEKLLTMFSYSGFKPTTIILSEINCDLCKYTNLLLNYFTFSIFSFFDQSNYQVLYLLADFVHGDYFRFRIWGGG